MKKMTKIDIIHDILLDCRIKHHIFIDDEVIEWCDEISKRLILCDALEAVFYFLTESNDDRIAWLDCNYDEDFPEEEKKKITKKQFKALQDLVRSYVASGKRKK